MAIIKQERGGITYIYESISYRDKETKQPRSKRKLIGRLDPTTGNIVPTDGRRRQRASNPAKELSDIDIKKNDKKISIIKDIVPQNKDFSKIFQNNPLNAVAHTSQKNLKINNSIMKATNKKYDVQVNLSLDKLPNLNLNVPAHKVLDSLMLKLTKQLPSGESISLEKIHKARKVSLNVNEYMNLCGIKDRTTARKQLNEAVNTIYNLSLDWSEKRYGTPEGKKKKTLEEKKYSIRILDSKSETISENPVKNGAVEVIFTYEIAEYLARRSSFIMWYSEDILKINSKLNPHSYYMMRLFLEHNNRNIAGKNANRVSVKTLIDACPDLPLYDDVMQKYQGHITQKIIDPIERDLDALVKKYKILKNWQYCNSNGAPLTKGQLYQYDYDTWIKWLIEFEFPDTFPDQTERIKKIQER